METLNPTSVNTVRVLTFKGEVITATLRIGAAVQLSIIFIQMAYVVI